MDEFGCGVVVALLLRGDGARRLAAQRYAKVGGLLASLVVLAAAAMTWDKYSPERTGRPFWHHQELVVFWPLLFSAASAGVVLFAQQFDRRFGRALARTRLPYLGVISYSIYLLHTIVISTTIRALSTTKAPLPAPILAGITLVGILVVAGASYSLVERRFMDIRTRYGAA
jgi:peptidoglycan/LPS O-acetylase OafA/YrhL